MKLVVNNTIKNDTPRYFHGKLIPRTWIMVIDRKKAHVFRKSASGLDFVADAQPDFDRQAGIDTEHFTRQVSGWLYNAHKQDAFDRLVLVAAPKTLGNIRQVLPESISQKLVGQIDKDLTNMSIPDIKRNLSNVVYFKE